jgi:hypothetical protein
MRSAAADAIDTSMSRSGCSKRRTARREQSAMSPSVPSPSTIGAAITLRNPDETIDAEPANRSS